MGTVPKILLVVLAIVILYVAGAWLNVYGRREGPGEITRTPIPSDVVLARANAQRDAATSAGRSDWMFVNRFMKPPTGNAQAKREHEGMFKAQGRESRGCECRHTRLTPP